MTTIKRILAASVLAAITAVHTPAQAAVPESKDPIILTIHDWTGQYITTHIMGRVLEEMGYAYVEVDPGSARLRGEGIWVAISRDPQTGELRAASHNRNNSAAVAY